MIIRFGNDKIDDDKGWPLGYAFDFKITPNSFNNLAMIIDKYNAEASDEDKVLIDYSNPKVPKYYIISVKDDNGRTIPKFSNTFMSLIDMQLELNKKTNASGNRTISYPYASNAFSQRHYFFDEGRATFNTISNGDTILPILNGHCFKVTKGDLDNFISKSSGGKFDNLMVSLSSFLDYLVSVNSFSQAPLMKAKETKGNLMLELKGEMANFKIIIYGGFIPRNINKACDSAISFQTFMENNIFSKFNNIYACSDGTRDSSGDINLGLVMY